MLMKGQKGKIQMIVTFLAVLELMKTGEILVQQEELFDDMLIISQI
jgi:segregation and condensation protein A